MDREKGVFDLYSEGNGEGKIPDPKTMQTDREIGIGSRRILSLSNVTDDISKRVGMPVDIARNFTDFSDYLEETKSPCDEYAAIVIDTDHPHAETALHYMDAFFKSHGFSAPYVFLIGDGTDIDSVDYDIESVQEFHQFLGRLNVKTSVHTEEEDFKGRVLIVDDDEETAKRVYSSLRKNGYYVETHYTKYGAMERVLRGDFDVVIVDGIITDKANGKIYEGRVLSRIISEWAKEGVVDTKIILTGFFPNSDDVSRCWDMGISDLISKPYSDKQILESIDEITVENTRPVRCMEKNENVLIVDNYPAVLEMISEALDDVGFKNPYSVRNIREASDILDKYRDEIGLVIFDWSTPGKDEFLNKARKYRKAIVGMSGHSQGYILSKYPSEVDFLGEFDAFFKKPFDITSLIKTIEYLSEEDSLLRMPDIRPRGEKDPGRRIIVTGFSTAGKTTVCRLCAKIAPSVEMPVRYTTRARRTSEMDGVEFNFVSRDEFADLFKSGHIRNCYEDDGNLYSSDIPEPVGKDCLIPVCSAGFEEMMKLYPNSRAVYLGISPKTMLERLREGRPKTDARRYESAEKCTKLFDRYFPCGSTDRLFDRIIISDSPFDTHYIDHKFSSIRNTAQKLLRYIASLRDGSD